MTRSRGFTLIELMIAVAIIAILAAIAVPSYSDYVRRGRLGEAISALAGMRVKMEQYFQDNRTYVGACAAGTVAPPLADTANFDYGCSNLTGTTYTITAAGLGGLAGLTYTQTEAGRSTTIVSPFNWLGGGSPCWVLKKDGSC